VSEVLIECRVNPSEDAEKVVAAIRNIFPDAVLDAEGERVSGRALDTVTFSEMVRKQRIRDAARAHMMKSVRSKGWIEFYLNKQAAFVGAVNFVREDVILGGIRVRILSTEPETMVKALTA
jgi:predicted RNA binding protein with dsRBD fold (UPF0201 family)